MMKKTKLIRSCVMALFVLVALLLVYLVVKQTMPDIIPLLRSGDEQALEAYLSRDMSFTGILYMALLQIQMEQAGLEPSRQTRVNLPSRIRMATLYAVAQTVPDGIVINTSNLSEDWVGYCTIYGDSAGAFSPLGMYTTEEVIALGRVLGLPEKFLVKAPSDGLTGLTDEDNLGFTYHAVNEYIRRGVVDEKIKADIDHKHAVSRFKFQTLPVYQNGLPIVLEEPTDYYNPDKK